MGNVSINVPVADTSRLAQMIDELNMEMQTHNFSAAQLPQWQGHDGTGSPEGTWNRGEEKFFIHNLEEHMSSQEHGFSDEEITHWGGWSNSEAPAGIWDSTRQIIHTKTV